MSVFKPEGKLGEIRQILQYLVRSGFSCRSNRGEPDAIVVE
jgi:hypothetical protein